MTAQSCRLGRSRWRFQHGPIDLVLSFDGPNDECEAAALQAWTAFEGLLQDLVADLPRLRRRDGAMPKGPVARAMVEAVELHRSQFVTPMAAVAGAVSDHVLAAALSGCQLQRAFVNNGGDIALFLSPGRQFDTGIVGDISQPALDAGFSVSHHMPVRGIATSGWRGRSFSLGIADAVTVLAATAAQADVAATLLANAVNVDDDAIERAPANELDPDNDLGARLVTVAVPPLPSGVCQEAMGRAQAAAAGILAQGLIHGALIQLQGEHAAVGVCSRQLAA